MRALLLNPIPQLVGPLTRLTRALLAILRHPAGAIRLIRAIRAQGATIVFVEHLMRAVVELSDRVAVLNEGKLFALGAPREVMSDPRVISIYLGKAYAA